jgi:hypothetical protein
LRNAMESLKAGLGLRGDTPDQLLESLGRMGGPSWRRETLTKVIRAFALIQKRDSAAYWQAFDLLGQAVWDWAKAQDVLEPKIKEIWPTRPAPDEATKT